jgi:hypothetical protein
VLCHHHTGLREAVKNQDCSPVNISRNSNKSARPVYENGDVAANPKMPAKRVKSASGQPTTKLYKALQPLLKLTSKFERLVRRLINIYSLHLNISGSS